MQKNRLETAVIALTAAVVFGCAGYFLGTQSRGNTYQISGSEDSSAYEIETEETASADAEETDVDVEEADASDTSETSEAESENSADGETDSAEAASDESSDGKININTADSETLQTLRGIGEVRAQAIIDYREQYGDFETVEDILKVSGIGEGTLEKIIDYITVD